MAEKQDLDYTYSTIDRIFRLSIGETGDFSGAMYNGDFSMTLEQAQRAKHRFIAENLDIKKGDRVLDMGCGWGPFLNYATHELGAQCTGLTLSGSQAKACQKNGFEVYIKDCRNVAPEEFGQFDAIVSIGAFEHFCSIEDWKAGRQNQLYHDFFKNTADLLKPGGKFFLQTMVFGRNMIDYEKISLKNKKDRNAYALALMIEQFPGSWLPYGSDSIINSAKPYFNLSGISSGRLDYIETITQWRKRFRKFNLHKYFLYLSLLPGYFSSKAFRHRVEIFKSSPNRVCFEMELMDHYRMVFAKN